MCGITGFIDFKNQTQQSVLAKMLFPLMRRGPDDQGTVILNTPFACIGLAHSRLSILDLSAAGRQPYSFEGLYLTYNGEVYNFQDIQKKLIKKGYDFQSHSDTEVIIKAFHCWGIKAVQEFRGMFSFCLYDSHAHKVYLFRDRAGVKPLYYYHKNDLLLFGSTLSPLMQHPKFEKKLDNMGLSQYMQFGYIAPPHSIFQNTFKLKPGHYAVLNLEDRSFIEQEYWNVRNYIPTIPPVMLEEEATEQLDQLLQEAFHLRMVADVPVGCFLSGGIDSSLVTALLQKKQSSPLHTFTIGFAENKYNEAPYAKEIAQYLGTHHTEYYCTKKDALDIIPQLPEIYDEPFADESAVPTHLVAKLARQHVKVALSGDGGDELFGGYLVYEKFTRLFKKLKALPQRKALAYLLQCLPNTIGPFANKKYLKIKSLLSIQDDSLLYRTASSLFTPVEIKQLLGQYSFPNTLPCFSKNITETMMFTDFETYLPEDILLKVDRATMFIGLEGREPLLDHKLIEFAAGLPLHYKQQKNMLKNVLARYIPKELFERKKQGFGMPINEWLCNDLKHFVNEYLDESRIKKEGLLNPKYVQQLKQKLFAGKIQDNQVWLILMLQMWRERYL